MFKEDGGGHQKDHAYQHPRHRGGHATPKPCVKLRLLVRVGAGRLDGVGPLEIAVVQPCKHKVEYRAGHQYQEGQGHRAGVGEKRRGSHRERHPHEDQYHPQGDLKGKAVHMLDKYRPVCGGVIRRIWL